MRLRPLAFLSALALTGAANGQVDRSGWQAELSTLSHDVRGVVTVVDSDTIRVDNFYYDGAGFEVYVILAPENTNASISTGLRVSDNIVGTPPSGASITYDLPPGETVDGYEVAAVWCAVIGQNFGSGEFESVFTVDPGTLRAGTASEFRYEGATPNQPIVTAYSLTGSDPTSTSIGTVDLSQPIRRLPNTLATANGGGLLRVIVPSGTVGVDVWVQAYDLNSARLTPVVMRTVQ